MFFFAFQIFTAEVTIYRFAFVALLVLVGVLNDLDGLPVLESKHADALSIIALLFFSDLGVVLNDHSIGGQFFDRIPEIFDHFEFVGALANLELEAVGAVKLFRELLFHVPLGREVKLENVVGVLHRLMLVSLHSESELALVSAIFNFRGQIGGQEELVFFIEVLFFDVEQAWEYRVQVSILDEELF